MNIRCIEPRDLEQLIVLCREHACYEGLSFVETGQIERWGTDGFFVEKPSLFGWVCEPEGGGPLAGYMTATVDYSTWTARRFVYLDCLFLTSDHRGKGLGRRLMGELRAFAVRKACFAIEWQTPPTNESGLGFYRAIGAGSLAKVRLSLPVGQELAH